METREFGELLMLLSKLPEGAGIDEELLKHYVNNRVEKIVKSYPWSRLQKTALITTVAAYTTGTVSILSGATAGTGALTAFTAGMTGRQIRIGSTVARYVFTFVTPTSFTIDRAYEDAADVSGGSFRIWQPIYGLPTDLGSIKSIEVPTRRWDLDEKDREWLNRRDPARIFYGDPQVYVKAPDTSMSAPQVELYPGPEIVEGLPVEYEAKVGPFTAKSDLFPDWFSIQAIWLGVISDLNGTPSDKEALYLSEVQAMQNEDTRRRPPVEIQMADRFINHRMNRTAWGWRGRFSNDPRWN